MALGRVLMRGDDCPSELPADVSVAKTIDYGGQQWAVLESDWFPYCPHDEDVPCLLVDSLDDERIKAKVASLSSEGYLSTLDRQYIRDAAAAIDTRKRERSWWRFW